MRKRFIAGAECPECGAIDKIYVMMTDDGMPESRHCNRCGYQEVRSEDDHNHDASKSQWQPVKIKSPRDD